ncbi:MAG TPA: gamma-glutamylcyclotransferase [Methylobacter sp.]
MIESGRLLPLFVYGTLRQGQTDHEEMQKIRAKYVGHVQTAALYHLQHLGNDKTGLVPGHESVPGELYLVTENALKDLKNFELDCYSVARVKIDKLNAPVFAFVLGANSLFDEPVNLHASVAAGDDTPQKEGDPPLDPKWAKVRTLYQTQMKNILKDLDDAIKHEDEKMVEYSYERMLFLMVSLAKALGLKSFTNQLKAVMEKNFGKGKEPPQL